MSLSEAGSHSASSSPARSSKISTIGEDFYNSIGVGSYISDEEEESDHPDNLSDSSSDTPIPYLSPQATTPPSSNQRNIHVQHDALLLSERSNGSKGSVGKRDISNGDDTLLLSERTTGSKELRDTSNGEDTLMFSERSTGSKLSTKRDISHGEDTLMLSERSDVLLRSDRSGGSKISSSKRDISQGDSLILSERSDTLIISDRSGGSNKPPVDLLARSDRSDSLDRSGSRPKDILSRSERSHGSKVNFKDGSNRSGGSRNFRDNSTGYDSLLVSETTDESWRRIANFAGDEDDSSISSTPSTPFPQLDGETEDESNDASLPPSGNLSQRMIQVIEKPPLAALSAPSSSSDIGDLDAILDEALASPTTTDLETNPSKREDSDEDRDLHGQDIEEVSPVQSNKIKANGTAAGTSLPVVENIDYDGSISTNNSLQNNERAGKIPRRWIIDRIDGTVREEDEGLPQWRRKPPLFLCLPSPLLGVFPWVFEENPFCVAVGKWGFFSDDTIKGNEKNPARRGDVEQSNTINNNTSDNASALDNETATNAGKSSGFLRTLIMAHAILLNACGLFATILSGLALTRSYSSLLKGASFGKTTVIPTLSSGTAVNDSPIAGDAVTLYLGLLALGIDNPTASAGGMVVVGFRDFCVTPGTEQFLSPEECSSCADVSVWIVVGYFLAIIAYLPTFAVGISRIYRNYDANCSKVSAGIWSLVSVIGYIVVLSCYSSCLGSLYEGEVLYTNEGAITDKDEDNIFRDDNNGEQFLVAEFDWKMGVGQVLFVIGLCLKVFDFVSNCCIATPAITRSRELQWDYEEGDLPQGEITENGNP